MESLLLILLPIQVCKCIPAHQMIRPLLVISFCLLGAALLAAESCTLDSGNFQGLSC